MSKEIIHSQKAPKALGPYSHGIKVGNLLFLSGQTGIDVEAGKLADGLEAQAHAVLTNLKNVLEAAGATFDNVVKCTIFIKDMNDFAKVNEIYGSYFNEPYPARSCVQVAKIPLDGLVEIECIAAL